MTGIGRRSIVRLIGGVLLTLPVVCDALRLRAEDTTSAQSAAEPISYRRIFVPADDTSIWPRGEKKYFPVEARDFESWVAEANRSATAAPPAAKITEASYRARLEGEQLVDGRGEWTIALSGDKPALVTLGPMSLVIREPHWNDDAEAAVRLGAWGHSGELPSTIGLEVARSGVVAFQWRVPAAAAAGESVFAWRLPTATTTRFILDLPAGKRPVWDRGLILRSEVLQELPANVGGGDAAARSAEVKPRQYVRWELIAGPNTPPTLRILDAKAGPAAAAPASTLILSEELAYDVSTRGLDIEARLHLEDTAAGHRQLAIPLPAGVQLVSATADDRDLSWRLASDGRDTATRAFIELPAPSGGAATTVVLRAWQSPAMDAAWQLPKLRPDDAFWTAGTIHLSLAPLIELQSLEANDCIQTDVQLAAEDNDSPEKITFAEYSPAATVNLVVGRRQPVAAARTGTTLVVGNADVTGRSITQLEVARGSLHKLSGELPPGWSVDAVETNPSEALGEWYLDERDGRRQIEMQLAEAVRPARPVTVTITGRLQPTNLGEPLSAATLQMVRWRDVESARHLLTLQTIEPYVVESVGELPLVASEALTSDDHHLLPAAAESPVYDLRNVDEMAAVRLATKKAQYTAEVWLDAVCAGSELRQTHHLVIRPRAGRVDQVLVFSSEKFAGDVRWNDKSSGSSITVERVPDDDPRRVPLPVDGELWRLHLPRPQSTSAEIDATVVTAWPSRRTLPLLSLPEATDQRGRVLLSVVAEDAPQLEARGLHAIPLPTNWTGATRADGDARIWAAYRYDPAECLNSARQPELGIKPATEDASAAGAIVRQLNLESFFPASGEAIHRATYLLESPFAASIPLQPPTGAQLTSAELDGRMLELPPHSKAGNPLTIPLAAGRPVKVSICFTTNNLRLASGSQLLPPRFESALPILAGEWTVWLPMEFVVVGEGTSTDGGLNWRKRLFGPLGRPTSERPFDPRQESSWSKLVTDWAEEGPADGSTPEQKSGGAVLDDVKVGPGSERAVDVGLTTGASTVRAVAPLVAERAGWRAYRRMFVAGVPGPVVIAHPPAATAWSVVVFLLCLAGGSIARRGREWFIGLLATAAMLCLLLPAAFAPLATGAFLGLLASLFLRWPRRADPADTPTRTWTRLAASGATGMTLAWAQINLVAAQPSGDAGRTNQLAEPVTIERVFMPVDAERRPTGSKVYVSEQFLRRLLAKSAASVADGGEWLLTKAAYRGELRRGPDGADEVAGEWRILLGIEVLGRDTTIRLPLVRNEAEWPATVQLDGIPLPSEWSADGQSCSIFVAEPGRYEMSISFVPRIRNVAGRNQIDLTLPPWRGATLELRFPADVNGLEVTGGNWQRRDNRSAGILSSELDDSGRMTVRWASAEAPSGPKDAQLTELRWLRIGTSGVEMDVKYVAPHDARLPKELTISADPRWELVNDEEASRDIRVAPEPNGRNTVHVGPAAGDRERGEVLLRWRLTGPPGLGRLRLPPIELAGAPAGSPWLAISSEPTLQCEIVDAAGLQAETSEEFLTLWGNGEDREAPQLVLGNVVAAKGLTVGTCPRALESAIDEVLHVAAGADTVRVQYQADVVPGRAHRFQYSMIVPDELIVDQITVMQASRPVTVRWSRPTTNRVNAYFGERLGEPYRLVLAGHLSIRGATGCQLPRVASASWSSVVERVQVYRDESVLVDVQGPANADDAAADLPPTGWNARLLAAYQVDSSTADQVRLDIKPNRVETVGETLTTLSHEDALWWATFNARLAVRQGEMDAMRLRIPANWVGPFDVQPAGASVATKLPVDGHMVLTVRLPESIGVGETLALEIRGPIAPENGTPVSVPEIAPVTPAEWQSYLGVPSAVQSQEVAWTDDGVTPAEPPGNLRPSRTSPAMSKAFRVMSTPYRVALAPTQAEQPTASVRMADTTVIRDPEGNQLIAARFVISPHGLTECELEIPGLDGLYSASLDGKPARVEGINPNRWRVQLGAPQLPQILDIVSSPVRKRQANPGRVVLLERPILYSRGTPIPVEMSLWSFGQGRIVGRPQVARASLVDAVDQAALRLDRLASIADAATPAAGALPIPDGYDWSRSWAELLGEAQDAARITLASSSREGAASQVTRSRGDQLLPATERISTWIERSYDVLGWPDLGPPLDPPGTTDGRATWPPKIDGIDGWVYCVADGGADRITVELSPIDATSTSAPYFGALVVVVVAAASVWLVRQPVARDMFHRWPHAVGVLTGLIWWAWLWPSWLGIVIAAGSLLLLFRPGWPGRSMRAEGSTVLQVGRPR